MNDLAVELNDHIFLLRKSIAFLRHELNDHAVLNTGLEYEFVGDFHTYGGADKPCNAVLRVC